jgi:predicted enzyme related to lactoylglutathione lyase
MATTQHPEGSVCWIDLGTAEPEKTQAFYSALFGWTVAEPDPVGYQLCTLRGKLVAALGPGDDAGPPYWTVNIAVADIDAAAARFESLGAQIIVPPVAAGVLGSYAVALDPVGAPVSLWQPGSHSGMGLVHEPGAFAGISLLTGDADRAATFYRRALHWNDNLEHTAFRLPDDSVVIIGPPPGAPTVQRSLWLVGFASDNPDADAERARRLGATRLGRDSSGGVVLRDPAGALFTLARASRPEGFPQPGLAVAAVAKADVPTVG